MFQAKRYAIAVALSALLFCERATAQVVTWGGSEDTSWTDGLNWSSNPSAPANDGSAQVAFNLASLMTSDVNNDYSISSLTIGSGAGSLLLESTAGHTLTIGSSLVDSSYNPVTVSVNLAGAGYVFSNGNGVLTLSGNNTYTGGTTINAGTLAIGSDTALGTGALTLASGTTLTVALGSFAVGNDIALSSGGPNTVTLLGGTMGGMLELDGMITGSPTLLVAPAGDGTNTLILTSPCSTFSGGVSVQAGNTVLEVGASSSSDGSVYQGPLGTGTLMLSSGNNLTTTGSGTFEIDNDITLCGGGTVSLLGGTSGTTTFTLGGAINGSSALEINPPGSATYYVDLTSPNSAFSGGIRVDGGSTNLQVGASSTGTGSGVTAGPLGTGILTLNPGNNFTSLGGSCYTIGNDIALSGTSSDYVYMLYATQNPMLTLSGMISGSPILEVGSDSGTGSNYLALTSGCSTFSGGIQVDSGNITLAVGASSSSSEGTVYQGPLGTGTLMLSAGNNFTTIDSSCYTIGNDITLRDGGIVTLLGGGMGKMLELDGSISGSSALEIAAPGCSGSNTVVLTSQNSTFGGGVTVDAGNTTLVVGASGLGVGSAPTSSPLGTGALTLGNGGTLTTPSGVPITVLNDIWIGTGESWPAVTLGGASGATLTILGSISENYGASSLVIDGPTDLEGSNDYSGGTTVESTTLTVGNDSGLGTGSLTAIGSTLNFTSSMPSINTLSMQASVLNFAASSNPFINGLASDSPGSTNQINLGNGSTLTFELGADPDYYGTINGNGAVKVQGFQESLKLYGANTYAGGTTIDSGIVLVAGNASALGTGAVTINSGGALGVDSGITITNQVTLNSGGSIGGYGTVAPASAEALVFQAGSGLTGGRGSAGNGDLSHPVIGTLTFGANASIEFGGGGGLQFSLMNATGTAGTDYSIVNIDGSLNLTASSGNEFNIQLLGVDSTGQVIGTANAFNSSQTYQWTLLTASGGITGFTGSNQFSVDSSTFFSNSIGIGGFYVSESGNSLMLNFTPVPEPSTWALMGTGVCVLVGAIRRRRR